MNISFANIIRETVPKGSKFGRIGGDEFVSFCTGVDYEDKVAESINQRCDSVDFADKIFGAIVPKDGAFLIYNRIVKCYTETADSNSSRFSARRRRYADGVHPNFSRKRLEK